MTLFFETHFLKRTPHASATNGERGTRFVKEGAMRQERVKGTGVIGRRGRGFR